MADDGAQWSLARRLGVTFLGLFLCLNIIPLMLVAIPVVEEPLTTAWMAVWAALTPVLGRLVGIEGPIDTIPNGSSDMTWNYLQQLCYLVVAAVATIAWVARVRRQATYEAMLAWVRIVLRYGLSLMMFSYGLIKVFPLQFEPLGPIHLARTYGESTPSGLLWTFMGYSPAYTVFTGLAEVLAAALLLSRRTATLGALLAVGVLANVAMMNFCYDVPVKIYSSVFLLMALFLAGQDLPRIVDVFVRNRAPTPAELSQPALGRRLRIARLVAKAGFLVTVASMAAQNASHYAERQAQVEGRPALYGAWEVERFILDGEERPPRDALRWRQFVVPSFPAALIKRGDGEQTMYGLAHDPAAGTITLTAFDDSGTTMVLAAARPASDELVLT
ncbi:MAG TPA: hypothetical protein VIK91_21800, partial [Nannocystis sp.]